MKRLFKTSLFALGVVAVSALSADAAAIRIYDGTNEIIIYDNGAGDTNAAPGIIQHSTALGTLPGFNFVAEAGITKPALGSPQAPVMDFSVYATTGFANGGTLTASFSETGFGPSSTLGTNFAGGTAGNGGIDYQVLQDTGNNLFTGTVIDSVSFPTGSFSYFDTVTLASTSPYSLTQQFTIRLNGQFQQASVGANVQVSPVSVPDGGLALSLLGFALVGIEGLRRKFNG